MHADTPAVLLATVSPDRSCLAETLSTLEFAQRAKYVVNKVSAVEVGPGQKAAFSTRTQLESSCAAVHYVWALWHYTCPGMHNKRANPCSRVPR